MPIAAILAAVHGPGKARQVSRLFHLATVDAAAADPLSGREREVVLLAVAGLASKDIAERLYLSVRTVNNHLQHAYAKLGVTSRASLAQALGSTI
jgi:DNA-binding NarL/FixJ family response regulator